MCLPGLGQMETKVLFKQVPKILEIAKEQCASTKYREALFYAIESMGSNFRNRSIEELSYFIVRMLKKETYNIVDCILFHWVNMRLEVITSECAPQFEISSWKDLLFLYQVTYLLKLDSVFGPSVNNVLGKFELVPSSELSRLNYNAMVMLYGLLPLRLEKFTASQKKSNQLAVRLVEKDFNDKDWVKWFNLYVDEIITTRDEFLTQAKSMRSKFFKLRDCTLIPAESLFLDKEGLDFIHYIFSEKHKLDKILLELLRDETKETVDYKEVQQFFSIFSEIIEKKFPHDYKLLRNEYESLKESVLQGIPIDEKAPRLSALMQACQDKSLIDRDETIWEDFTSKFVRTLAEGEFVFLFETHTTNCKDESIIETSLQNENLNDNSIDEGSSNVFDLVTSVCEEEETLSVSESIVTFLPDQILIADEADLATSATPVCQFSVNSVSCQNIKQSKEYVDEHVMDEENAEPKSIFDPRDLSLLLLKKGQTAALYWLAKSVPVENIPPWLAELVYLGTCLRPGFVASKDRVGVLLRQATKEIDSLSLPSSLLMAAAILRPALMMPSNEQSYIINNLTNVLRYNGKPLMERLAKFVTQNTPLEETIFLHQSQIAKSQERLSRLREQTQSFLEHAPQKKLVYAPATFAFRQLFNRNTGELGKVLQACIQEDFSLLSKLNLEEWARDSFISNKMNQLEKDRNPLSTKAIDYKAREAFKRQVFCSLSLLQGWKLFEKPSVVGNRPSYVQREFFEIIGEARKFDEGLVDVTDCCLSPFSNFLRENLKKLIGKFQSDDIKDTFLDPLDGLDLWLLNMPEFTFEGAQISLSIDTIGKYLNDEEKIPPIGLEEHIYKGNFALVNKYFNVFQPMESEPCSFDQQKKLRAFFDEEFSKQIGILETETERIIDRIEDYYLRGVIAEEKELELRIQASDLEQALKNNKFSILEIRDSLRVLDGQLESSGEEQRKLLLADLENLKTMAHVTDDILSFFVDCLEKNEISTAHEELAALQWKASNGVSLALRDNLSNTKFNYANQYFESFLPDFAPSNMQQKNFLEETDKYIKDWHKLFSRTLNERTFQGLLTQMVRLIGFELERESKLEVRSAEGSPFYWQVFKCSATIPSPLSKWGSEARGEQYIVFTPDSNVKPSELGRFLESKMRKGELHKSMPITVLTQATYGEIERKRLIKIGQNMSYMPLVVDTPMFYWLLSFGPQERIKALFASGLAGAPFNPYTPTVAGAVPGEMFYGRERDIESLWDPMGPCIVYGGRQLGKSALLKRVTHLYNKPQDGQHVRYDDVRSESDLIDVVLRSLKSMKIISNSISIKGMPEAIRQFLDKNPNSRILLLLDECDLLIKSDMHKVEMPGLSTIRGIMTDTNRRFKVVLAGLESVQRYSHMPNTPFPHYGVPLCVGPLQPKPARELVEEPMASVGLYLESPELIQRVLVHTNHNPSLIQLFCHELVDAMHERAWTGEGRHPRMITKEIIAQVYRRANLRNQIRERFEWTLELDPRYKVTGYTLALMQEYSQGNGMGRGFRPREILSELMEYWPLAFKTSSKEEVGSILTEMEGLGIVLKLGDTYRLRSPNIINLLGGSSNILDELSSFAYKPYDKEGAWDMRPVLTVDSEKFSSPLALSQINEIKMSKTGLVLVTGSSALGLDRVGHTLRYMEKYDIPVCKIKGVNSVELLRNLKEHYRKIDNSGCLVWFDCEECIDFVRIVSDIHAWLERLHSEKKYISVVVTVGTKDILDLYLNDKIRHVMESPFVRHLTLGKWRERDLDEWFHKLPKKLDQQDSIISSTGGWDDLVMQALHGDEVSAGVLPVKKDFFMPQHPIIGKILEIYRAWNGPISVHDFLEFLLLHDSPLLSDIGEKGLEKVLEALIVLGVFVQSPDENTLILDSRIEKYQGGEVA